ncbi:Protein tyrosine kinase [Musa troglodytarum]|uniref:Protein tyrosine kinase n=1 Tax=Musa troglodytarum TaxID=320322 RepID=A0A9E7EV26_9LILI|nr:Protein tyrosine kinase [Musa troglodytarum]
MPPPVGGSALVVLQLPSNRVDSNPTPDCRPPPAPSSSSPAPDAPGMRRPPPREIAAEGRSIRESPLPSTSLRSRLRLVISCARVRTGRIRLFWVPFSSVVGDSSFQEMVDSLDVVLEFFRKNRFTKAEAALRGELNARSDLNGFLQKHLAEEKEAGRAFEEVSSVWQQSTSTRGADSSKEFIVKEIEVGGNGNGFDSKKSFGSTQGRATGSVDLYPWNFSSTSSISNSPSKEVGATVNNFAHLLIPEESMHRHSSFPLEKRDRAVGTEPDRPLEQRVSCAKGKDKAAVEVMPDINLDSDCEDKNAYSRDHFLNDLWVKNEDPLKGCSVDTVFPFPLDYAATRKSGKSQESAEQNFDLQVTSENYREELPRLPPVRLKSEDKLINIQWDEKPNCHGSEIKLHNGNNAFMNGSYLDVPVGQEINSSGGTRNIGSSWLSVSQGIAEDTSDLVSGFATVGNESFDYPIEYWDSDEYDDDDDVGYTRQPIEDETWFLSHEVDYPSDNEKGTGHGNVPDHQDQATKKDEDDDHSFADSYLSGEQYFQTKNAEQFSISEGPVCQRIPKMHRTDENSLIAHYDEQLIDAEEPSLMHSKPVWQGFVGQYNEILMLANRKGSTGVESSSQENPLVEDDQHDSVRSIGVGINSDAAEFGSEVDEHFIRGSSEVDIKYFPDHDVSASGRRYPQNGTTGSDLNRRKREKMKQNKEDSYIIAYKKDVSHAGAISDGDFSFPPSLKNGGMLYADLGKSLWSSKASAVAGNSADECANGTVTEDMLPTWRKKSSDSSPVKSSTYEKTSDAARSRNSSPSSASNYGYIDRERTSKGYTSTGEMREEGPEATLEDEEIAALQEQVRQIKAQEEEFETFHLKIVHRKNRHVYLHRFFFQRTGFEEDKNFQVVLNSVIAGRYHVTEYLGSAAFSKAIQAHDLQSGMDVCMKIIKNNKDFFDQSLDEIKLLKFVNKNDPADKYHILRLYDYFYYREHLLIVCELLKANLYEFHKFNRESGGEVYFTMPRLQSITIQCLEALQFLHGLGLIHCDLKPENILIKSYSRCEVKVIDLGSSCFETDHLCSYVQSRSYRAPEVILGLPYDKKIDIWSLGCILAELCTGNVLFLNDSPATLLARVIGIVGPIDQWMLSKGHDTYKYFTKNHRLYERNQETNRLEYLIPKKTSLSHRLPMGDQGFIDFVAYILETNPKKRPSASEALKHPWLSYPYEPISS